MTTMLVRRTAVIPTVPNMILVNMKMRSVTIMMSALMIHAAHILDVFTLTIPTNVLLPMHVPKLTVISPKDVLLKMIPNAVTIPTSVTTSHAILK